MMACEDIKHLYYTYATGHNVRGFRHLDLSRIALLTCKILSTMDEAAT